MKHHINTMSRVDPTSVLVDQISDKWAIFILLALVPGSLRFGALRRRAEGLTHKVLGRTLRKLERNGLVRRRAFTTMPMRVEYSLTTIGQALIPIIESLRDWAVSNSDAINLAQMTFDRNDSERGDVN